MFWYYLEEIAKAPKIQDEKCYPLVRMPFDDIRHWAFRVLVYNRRIAVEYFHALTDGNGALVAFRVGVDHSVTVFVGIDGNNQLLGKLLRARSIVALDLKPISKCRVTAVCDLHGGSKFRAGNDLLCNFSVAHRYTEYVFLSGVSKRHLVRIGGKRYEITRSIQGRFYKLGALKRDLQITCLQMIRYVLRVRKQRKRHTGNDDHT